MRWSQFLTRSFFHLVLVIRDKNEKLTKNDPGYNFSRHFVGLVSVALEVTLCSYMTSRQSNCMIDNDVVSFLCTLHITFETRNPDDPIKQIFDTRRLFQ